jgi:outer membrane protein assembly factor BamB
VDGDWVYALGGQGELVCVETATGKERWRKNLPRDFGGEVNPIGGGAKDPTPLGWGYAAAPLVDGDQLICVPGGRRGLLAALDKTSGQLLWQSRDVPEQATYSSPVLATIGGIRQYVAMTYRGAVGVAAKDGKLLWQYERKAPYGDVVIPTPLVRDDHVYLTSGFGEGCDLLKVTANGGAFQVDLVYANKNMVNRDGGVVLIGDRVYGHSETHGWTCQNFLTGETEWWDKKRVGRGPVTFADGQLYCLDDTEGDVILQRAAVGKGCQVNGRFRLPQASTMRRPSGGIWTHPVIANGRLYLRDQELLFCYDIKATK